MFKEPVVNFECKTPATIANTLSRSVCVQKTNARVLNLFILGIFAGVYIAFGAAFATLVSSDMAGYLGVGLTKIFSGAVFSVGLMLVVIAGAELFTGNNLMLMSILDKRVGWTKVARKLLLVYIANFVGSLLFAFIMFKTDLWQGSGYLTGIQALKIANAKVNLSFIEAFFRGIGCNWLVCLAVWMAFSSRDITGKIFAVFFPIMTFVALGFEHCIANMYFIPMGIFLKGTEAAVRLGGNLDSLNWLGFIRNIIPVTIGNVIGGAFFVGLLYWMVYVRKQEN